MSKGACPQSNPPVSNQLQTVIVTRTELSHPSIFYNYRVTVSQSEQAWVEWDLALSCENWRCFSSISFPIAFSICTFAILPLDVHITVSLSQNMHSSQDNSNVNTVRATCVEKAIPLPSRLKECAHEPQGALPEHLSCVWSHRDRCVLCCAALLHVLDPSVGCAFILSAMPFLKTSSFLSTTL